MSLQSSNQLLEKTYVIGDVHGCYHTLLKLIDKLPKDAKLIFVGDLCDKGNYSKEVIEYVKSQKHICIKGNHEHLYEKHILEAVAHNKASKWSSDKRYGGKQTITSYQGDIELIKEHLKWISELPVYVEVAHYFITHGYGLKYFHGRDDERHYFDLLLNRLYEQEDELCINADIINIFGHCAFDEVKEGRQHICIDTSCVNDGVLTAIALGTHTIVQEPLDPKDSDYRLKSLRLEEINLETFTIEALQDITLADGCRYYEYDLLSDELLEALVMKFEQAGLDEIYALKERNVVFPKQFKKLLLRFNKS